MCPPAIRIDPSYLSENHLQYISQIDYGSFGSVHLVYSIQYDQHFALKVIQKRKFDYHEVSSLVKFDCPYVTRLYGFQIIKNVTYLLMEYCPETLQNKVKKEGRLLADVAIQYAKEILMGLNVCHQNGISHGDIKTSNILLDSYGRVKICDFGMSDFSDDPEGLSQHFRGSFPFMDSEIIDKKAYDRFKADIYSFGVTFYYMLTGHYPWRGIHRDEIIYNIVNRHTLLHLIGHPEIEKIIERCISLKPEERPSAQELLNMPIFSQNISPINKPKNYLDIALLSHKSKASSSTLTMAIGKIIRPRRHSVIKI